MCRAIKTLHNFSPPATDDEIRASSLQFVRKVSGFTKPSKANEDSFNFVHRAIEGVLVCFRRFSETAHLSNELERWRADFIVCRWRTEVMKCFDSSAHKEPLTADPPP